jgi:hypothetical protein
MYIDSKIYFHQSLDYVPSQAIKLLDLIHAVTFSFLTTVSVLMLYCTSVRSKLEHTYVAWNTLISTDISKLRILKVLSFVSQSFLSQNQLCE